MSEFKLISPLLDNFQMGDPISCHDGVRCCPAMENGSNNKYIVKIISIPASQVQLDALLLTGAYTTTDAADAYFRDVSKFVSDEAATLRKLSALEGFVSYENWQTVPMDHGTGYNLYLLGEYRRTLEQYLKKNPMTHLGAVNLGLDLCAAMAVCRHSGYLYIDLKPGNICIEDNKGYRVFDLGFVKLSGLKYASMPDKYFSQYTAPEITDAFSSLNDTIDIYAIGLILYQTYNGGTLPFTGDRAPTAAFPPPAYADYEMADIILKACAPDPKDRWSDPVQMGQALVSYMQRNGVNDIPIVSSAAPNDPFEEYSHVELSDDLPADKELPNDVESVITEDLPQESLFDDEEVISESHDAPDAVAADISADAISEVATAPDDDSCNIESGTDIPTENTAVHGTECTESVSEPILTDSIAAFDVLAESPAPEVSSPDSAAADEIAETEGTEIIPENSEAYNIISEEDNLVTDALIESLAFLDKPSNDETEPNATEADEDYNAVSGELSDILTYADELLSHPIPDPVVPPQAIDIPVPAPILPCSETDSPAAEDEESACDEEQQQPEAETINIPEFTASSSSDDSFPIPTDLSDPPPDLYLDEGANHNSSLKKWIVACVLLLLTAALAFVGFYYYQNYYLQPISINPSGNENSLVVYVTSGIAENKLTVHCADTYGNSLSSPVIDGKAVFTDLAPGSGYTITVEADGFHRLTGNTSTAYSTPVQTNVVQFSAIAGPEDGSVILSFAIDGPDSQQWSVTYTADGETKKAQPFSGHMVTVVGLTVGKEYTFTLESESSVYITGNNQLVWLAEKNILAEDLVITSCDSNKLTATWTAPENVTVDSWSVRCYNESGFDMTVKTDTTSVAFENIDHTKGYTLEVTAANMTVSSRTFISANSMTVGNFNADCTNPEKLLLTWSTTHPLENGNWILLYSADGLNVHEVSGSADNWIEIKPIIPNSHYTFTLMTSTGSHVFNDTFEYFVNQSPDFNNYNVSADKMEFNMCKTPDKEDWDRFDLKADDYKTSFAIGEKASFLIRVRNQYNPLSDNIVSLFVIRNQSGEIVNVATSEQTWVNMWYKGYCELDIPVMPTTAGNYTITVYFNGYYAGERDFTITSTSSSRPVRAPQ